MFMSRYLMQLKNIEMNGTLARKLRYWRKTGRSYRWISAELSKTGTPVHRATVDLWCRELKIAKKEAHGGTDGL